MATDVPEKSHNCVLDVWRLRPQLDKTCSAAGKKLS
jgi:hypothetical protein